jgi:PTS system cellobiose-specific IIC component
MAIGLVNRTLINVSSTVPVGVGQWLSSLDYRAVILTVVCIAANMLVYYPFYKLFEKEKLAEEQMPSEQNPEDAIEVY